MMDYRENAGYIITDSCRVGDIRKKLKVVGL